MSCRSFHFTFTKSSLLFLSFSLSLSSSQGPLGPRCCCRPSSPSSAAAADARARPAEPFSGHFKLGHSRRQRRRLDQIGEPPLRRRRRRKKRRRGRARALPRQHQPRRRDVAPRVSESRDEDRGGRRRRGRKCAVASSVEAAPVVLGIWRDEISVDGRDGPRRHLVGQQHCEPSLPRQRG